MRRGFTLIEILVVIAIISILAGITVIGYTVVSEAVRFGRARGECAMLQSACKGYRALVGEWPAAATQAEILAILMSQTRTDQRAGPPALDDLKHSQVDATGTMIDPWGNPYVIEFSEEGVKVYSFGPDGESDGGHSDGDGCPASAHASLSEPIDDVRP